jgi:hypothetical protein
VAIGKVEKEPLAQLSHLPKTQVFCDEV